LSILDAILIAIVEGLTEFLPVSSTGHMIIAQEFLGLNSEDAFNKAFLVNIQLGAILSVVVLYWKKFFQSFDLYFKLFIAFVPAAIVGFTFSKQIDAALESPLTVAITLLLGGIVFLFIDKIIQERSLESPSYSSSFIIGLFQCIAMIPGVSRSAATIIGGMTQGLKKKAAAEFSFFLAIPTMLGATVFKMKETLENSPEVFNAENMKLLGIGNFVAFLVGIIAIKTFVNLLTKYGFKPFGYYRIILGSLLLILLMLGVELKIG
jgi:undecaprenyl-diphosphatase